ncbi:GH12300 [Drosophila grimshawi]|uniref:GH12300 n=1 Tax=Drosophila grimshawi TaxID=7222 RepID=B4JJ97_DROGR|nr:GH12300 [Drosophila grimshawi]
MRQQLSTGQMHTRPAYAQTSLAATLTAQQQQQQQRAEKSLGFFPSWKTLALASLAGRSAGSVAGNLEDKRNAYYLPQPRLLLNGNAGSSQELDNDSDNNNNSNSMDIDLSVNAYGSNGNNATRLAAAMGRNEDNSDVIDTIENEVARAHDLLDLELSGHGFRRSPSAAAATSMSQQHLGGSSSSSGNGSGNNLYTSMPAGIRSAIVASAAIVLTSMATLLVIFVVCRWKQHRRRKTSYLKTYNAMKSKLPQLAQTANASRRNSLREHMEELVIGSSSSNSNCNSNSSSTNNNSINNNSCHKPISVATVSCNTPVHHHHHHQHQLQRQSSLLFNREGSTCSSQLAASKSTAAGAASVSATTSTATATAKSAGGGRGGVNSLALTLRTAHQKLNTMDPNSPEVQEYLFDTLRKSFDN